MTYEEVSDDCRSCIMTMTFTTTFIMTFTMTFTMTFILKYDTHTD